MRTRDPRAKSEVARGIYEQGDALVSVARAIHADPEIAYAERHASARLVNLLSDSGFEIRTGVGALATAFVASHGSGALRLALCAEYDALDGGVGHGSGRHLVAGAALGAAIGLARSAGDAPLTVFVVGTPAAALLDLDEVPAGRTTTGKQALLEAGAFDGAHAVFALYPSAAFTGFARSGASGRLQALVTTRSGARPTDLADLSTGPGLRRLEDRLLSTAAAHTVRSASCRFRSSDDGAALTGDVRVSAGTLRQADAALADVTHALERIAARSNVELGVTRLGTLRQVRGNSLVRRAFLHNAASLGLVTDPTAPEPIFSSDIGDVSATRPVLAPMIALRGSATLGTPEFAALADTADAYRTMLHGAVALAWTAYDIATDEGARSRLLGGSDGVA